ncbi:MAG TPA: hypothetical protein VFA05_01045 [Gaiellaceae bacterium]|nr:hypothetical protein [Gaiellaceae bacterium]
MYRKATALSAVLMIGLGVALVVVTLLHGFGVGILLGVLFMAAGTGRLWLLDRRRVR